MNKLSPLPTLEFKRALKSSNGAWYRVVEWIGRGGNNVVYLCVSSEGPAANSLVAIKFSLAYSHEARHKRFLHEIAFLKKHTHPNILRVIDWGTWEENTTEGIVKYPFFVTEYLPKTLGDVIRERSANATEKAAYIMQVLSALAYLSEVQGEAIHRDVKPHNVFIAANAACSVTSV